MVEENERRSLRIVDSEKNWGLTFFPKIANIEAKHHSYIHIMSNTQKSSGLTTVQNLYVMQMQLMGYLQGGTLTQDQAKEATQCLKQFTSLLGEADPKYMGGEDVLETLQDIQQKMAERLKARAARSRTARKAAGTTSKVKKTKGN